MSFTSETASIILLLTRWRSLSGENPAQRIKQLHVQAQRCSRLAQGSASFAVAEELEAMSQALQKEAEELAASMQAAAYQIYSPGLRSPKRSNSMFCQQLISARLV